MALFCSDNRPSCVTLAIIASAILGVVATLLQVTAVITVSPAFLWVALGIAIVYLAVLVSTAEFWRTARCVNGALTALLTAILGTALTSVILLAVTFANTSVIGAIFVGLLILFLSLIVSSSACFVSRCGSQQHDC